MRWLVASVLVLAACGGAPPPARPAPEPIARPAPRLLPPVTDRDLLDEPLVASERVELPVSDRAPSRVEHLRTLRPAFVRCGARARGALSAAFGACACEVMCRARFPAEEEITTIRFPFLDVDGLAFTIEPDGRVSACEYSVSGTVLADARCGELPSAFRSLAVSPLDLDGP